MSSKLLDDLPPVLLELVPGDECPLVPTVQRGGHLLDVVGQHRAANHLRRLDGELFTICQIGEVATDRAGNQKYGSLGKCVG